MRVVIGCDNGHTRAIVNLYGNLWDATKEQCQAEHHCAEITKDALDGNVVAHLSPPCSLLSPSELTLPSAYTTPMGAQSILNELRQVLDQLASWIE
jgi:hypothetical protein